MKFAIAILLVFIFTLLPSSMDAAANRREKRGILDCPKKVAEASDSCGKTLDDRLNLNAEVEKKLNEDSPSAFQCCYYAEYEHCIKSATKEDCGDTVSSAISSVLTGPRKVLQGKCSDDSYPSVKCIFFVWFYYIIAAIVVIILLSVACCVARCICGKK